MPKEFDRGASGTQIQQFSREVLWLDDCKGSFKYVATGTGGDDVHTYDGTGSFFSTNGIHLVTRTTDTADGDNLKISRKLSYPVGCDLYTRLRIGVADVSLLELFEFGINLHTGSREFQAGLQYKPNVPSMSYHNGAGTKTALATLAHQMDDWQQSIIEFSICLTDTKYLSALFLGTEVDMSAMAFQDVGASALRMCEFWINIETAGAAAAAIFGDSVYVGANQTV